MFSRNAQLENYKGLAVRKTSIKMGFLRHSADPFAVLPLVSLAKKQPFVVNHVECLACCACQYSNALQKKNYKERLRRFFQKY